MCFWFSHSFYQCIIVFHISVSSKLFFLLTPVLLYCNIKSCTVSPWIEIMRADSSLVELPISSLSSPPAPQTNLKTTQHKNEFLREGNCKGRDLEAVGVQCLCVCARAHMCICIICGLAMRAVQDPTLQVLIHPTKTPAYFPNGLKFSMRYGWKSRRGQLRLWIFWSSLFVCFYIKRTNPKNGCLGCFERSAWQAFCATAC